MIDTEVQGVASTGLHSGFDFSSVSCIDVLLRRFIDTEETKRRLHRDEMFV